jgi:hypothetical protein
MFTISQRRSPEDNFLSPRVLGGVPATVGWKITRDRVVFWCGTCAGFHISTGHSRNDVRSCCPKMDEGEKFFILNFGPIPVAILWSMYKKCLNAETRRELCLALDALDALVESEEIVS